MVASEVSASILEVHFFCRSRLSGYSLLLQRRSWSQKRVAPKFQGERPRVLFPPL